MSQRDGSPPHASRNAIRSPDLISLDFYLSGHVKEIACTGLVGMFITQGNASDQAKRGNDITTVYSSLIRTMIMYSPARSKHSTVHLI